MRSQLYVLSSTSLFNPLLNHVSQPSPRVAVIKFQKGIQQGLLGRISRTATMEYHGFGIISEGIESNTHYIIAGVQGDWTRGLVSDPPTHLWTREMKVSTPFCLVLRSFSPHCYVCYFCIFSLPVFRTSPTSSVVALPSALALASALSFPLAYNSTTGFSSGLVRTWRRPSDLYSST